MLVVAGPPGSGKSVAFPVNSYDIDAFSVDNRCAELNDGSYRGISPEIRRQASNECRQWIDQHIKDSRSFAVETTLRTIIAIDQAKAASNAGFRTMMIFVSTVDPMENVARVRIRADAGGHSSPSDEILATFEVSNRNLELALRTFDQVRCYDNSTRWAPPELVAHAANGVIQIYRRPLPPWLDSLLPRKGESFNLKGENLG